MERSVHSSVCVAYSKNVLFMSVYELNNAYDCHIYKLKLKTSCLPDSVEFS